MTQVIIDNLLPIYMCLITILIAPSNLDINANIRYGNPPHVDERHRHRYEVYHVLQLLTLCYLYVHYSIVAL